MYQFNCNTLLLSRSKNINGMIITVKEFPDETEKKKLKYFLLQPEVTPVQTKHNKHFHKHKSIFPQSLVHV